MNRVLLSLSIAFMLSAVGCCASGPRCGSCAAMQPECGAPCGESCGHGRAPNGCGPRRPGLRERWCAWNAGEDEPPPELPPPAWLHPVPTAPVFGVQLSGREAGQLDRLPLGPALPPTPNLPPEPGLPPEPARFPLMESAPMESKSARRAKPKDVYLNSLPTPTLVRRASHTEAFAPRSEIRFAQ